MIQYGCFTIHAPSFGLNATVDLVCCILEMGQHNFAIDIRTWSQVAVIFTCTSNYNFVACFFLAKLRNVVLILLRKNNQLVSKMFFFNCRISFRKMVSI